MIYIEIYLAIGFLVVCGGLIYIFQSDLKDNLTELFKEILNGEIPWYYRLRGALISPVIILIAILAITICWPLVIYVLIKESSEKARYLFIARKKFLLNKHSIEEIEAANIYTDPLGYVPSCPFGHLNKGWVQFLEKRKLTDKIFSFKTPKGTPYGKYGQPLEQDAKGYALLRRGKIIAEFIYESY